MTYLPTYAPTIAFVSICILHCSFWLHTFGPQSLRLFFAHRSATYFILLPVFPLDPWQYVIIVPHPHFIIWCRCIRAILSSYSPTCIHRTPPGPSCLIWTPRYPPLFSNSVVALKLERHGSARYSCVHGSCTPCRNVAIWYIGGALCAVRAQCTRNATICASGRTRDPYYEIPGPLGASW